MIPTMKQEYQTFYYYYSLINLLHDLDVLSYNLSLSAKINPPASIMATLPTDD